MRALEEGGVPAIDLSGRVAIVTGAAQGQGAAEARHFRHLGATVVMVDISDEPGRPWRRRSERPTGMPTSPAAPAWEELTAAVMAAHGRLDILVNNAAIHWMRLIEDEKIEDFDRLIGVNLRGTFLGIKSAIAPMRASGGGSIVNIASIAGVRGFQQHGSYGASKWAIRGPDQDGGGRARAEWDPGQCHRAGDDRLAHGVGRLARDPRTCRRTRSPTCRSAGWARWRTSPPWWPFSPPTPPPTSRAPRS